MEFFTMSSPSRSSPSFRLLIAALAMALLSSAAIQTHADTVISNPYQGITLISRSELNPRNTNVNMHIALIDLSAPGVSFDVTGHSGSLETQRQTTTSFISQDHAQLGINIAFFNPVVSASQVATQPDVYLAGLIASKGNIVSSFDPQPADPLNTVQSYAVVPFAPALNIDSSNNATIVHRDPSQADNQHILENVPLWNAVSGSAQIITDGTVTVPVYQDATHPDGLLTSRMTSPTNTYSNSNSWYNLVNARTAIGVSQDGHTLVLFTVDNAGGSGGLTVPEVANIMLNDYHCYEALNLDGGGSTAMSMQDSTTGVDSLLNASADAAAPLGRAEGVNLAVFALPVPEPGALWMLAVGSLLLAHKRRLF